MDMVIESCIFCFDRLLIRGRYQMGQIASGIGAGAGVRFGDIGGDGRDDYL
jgi:hypothetical protein